MSDKWHFDPNKDYRDDYSDESKGSFQRFKNKKQKKNNKQRESDFEKSYRKEKHRGN